MRFQTVNSFNVLQEKMKRNLKETKCLETQEVIDL